MRFLSAFLLLFSVLHTELAIAHQANYLCQGFCNYDLGNGKESKLLTAEDPDEQKAFDLLNDECRNFDGSVAATLVPTSPIDQPSPQDFCRAVWH